MPTKTATAAQLKAVTKRQDRIAAHLRGIAGHQAQIAEIMTNLSAEPASHSASKTASKRRAATPKRRATAPPTTAKPSPSKKVAFAAKDENIDDDSGIESEEELDVDEASDDGVKSRPVNTHSPSPVPVNNTTAAINWDIDDALLEEILTATVTDTLRPEVYENARRFLACALIERAQRQRAVADFQESLRGLQLAVDGIELNLGAYQPDTALMASAIKLAISVGAIDTTAAGAVNGRIAEGLGEGGVGVDDDEYEIIDE